MGFHILRVYGDQNKTKKHYTPRYGGDVVVDVVVAVVGVVVVGGIIRMDSSGYWNEFDRWWVDPLVDNILEFW